MIRALPEAWREDRAPSPTLLSALVTASDAVAQSDALVTDAGRRALRGHARGARARRDRPGRRRA